MSLMISIKILGVWTERFFSFFSQWEKKKHMGGTQDHLIWWSIRTLCEKKIFLITSNKNDLKGRHIVCKCPTTISRVFDSQPPCCNAHCVVLHRMQLTDLRDLPIPLRNLRKRLVGIHLFFLHSSSSYSCYVFNCILRKTTCLACRGFQCNISIS